MVTKQNRGGIKRLGAVKKDSKEKEGLSRAELG
jgi:hypothetical protein